ncbi:MAG: DUF3021 family protein [Candidatus Merdivicinus sp.]
MNLLPATLRAAWTGASSSGKRRRRKHSPPDSGGCATAFPEFCLYFGIFLGIYLFIWAVQYTAVKRRLQRMNAKIKGSGTL